MARRKVHSREFKLAVVARIVEGSQSVAQIASELGLDRCMLHRWERDFRAAQEQSFPGRGKLSPEAAELARLRRELAQAQMERDILKKVLTAFGGRKP